MNNMMHVTSVGVENLTKATQCYWEVMSIYNGKLHMPKFTVEKGIKKVNENLKTLSEYRKVSTHLYNLRDTIIKGEPSQVKQLHTSTVQNLR